MPTPDVRSEIIRGPLADVSTRFKNMSYIGDLISPIKDNVSHKAIYYKYRRGDWFRDEAALRSPGTKAKRGDFNLDSVNITTKQYAFAKAVTREDIESEGMQGAPPVNMQQDAIEYCADKVDLKKEKRIANIVQTTTWADGVGSGGEDVEGKWASSEAAATNTFFADIRKATIKIQSETGMTPNHLMLDFRTMEDLKENPLVADKIKYTQRNIVTADLIGSLLGVRVLVGAAIENTDKEKLTDTMTSKYVWEYNATKGSAFLFYRPAAMGLKVPTAMGQFRVRQEGGAGRLTRVFREEAEDQWVYETREDTDIVAIASQLGYAFKDTILT